MPSLSSRAVFQSTRPVWGATHSPASDPGCARISIHAPRVGRDSSFRRCPCTAAAFQSTRPVWGATRADGWRRYVLQHFNPRAPCGARRRGRLAAHAGMANFNPRAPCGARLGPALSLSPSLLISIHAPRVGRDGCFVPARSPRAISIHAPRVGRDQLQPPPMYGGGISIHAPRVGRDCKDCIYYHKENNFNPRAPCGARLSLGVAITKMGGFQSTRPVWGATTAEGRVQSLFKFQSTRPVWGATSFLLSRCGSVVFQSTRPVWGATSSFTSSSLLSDISIHAPRVGRDNFFPKMIIVTQNFNPRAPCGARRRKWASLGRPQRFQSTRPVWGATSACPTGIQMPWYHFNPRAPCGARRGSARLLPRDGGISIHAPRVGRDTQHTKTIVYKAQFQSTRPVWGATQRNLQTARLNLLISIHAPRVGRDQAIVDLAKLLTEQFQSTRPVWGATFVGSLKLEAASDFNPRAPCGARL